MIETRKVGGSDSPLTLFTLKNGKLSVGVLNYGATITSVIFNGRDVVLGCNDACGYLNSGYYYGATVGRVCNRIENGRFTLNGKEYRLSANQKGNSLHGGFRGFDKRFFAHNVAGERLELTYVSADGEEGYPAELAVKAAIFLDDFDLHIEYEAISDGDTLCNLTNHCYFNLNGQGSGEVLSHELRINADYFLPVNENKIPTGELSAVNGTPFDFRTAEAVGKRLSAPHIQLAYGNGYDHAFVLNGEGLRKVATLTCKESKTGLDVITDQKALQFYCARYSDEKNGKDGKTYKGYAAVCLEAEGFPNAINRPNFPSIVLKKGEKYVNKIIYRFKKL